MSDDELQFDVSEELLWEPILDPDAITVSADGGDVTLRGTVGSFREKREAAEAAKRVRGVKRVENELSVRRLDDAGLDDADLRGAVLQAMALNSAVPASIDATVEDGIVTLIGTAAHNYERDEAEFVAANVPGVIALEDLITLSVAGPTPEDVRHKIKKAFKRDARLDADALTIGTSDGAVTLSGDVGSWAEHDAAVNAAWAAPGVRRVDDLIVVDA